ncbi:MAG: glutamate--tRNA ligase, partial [Flavobacteriaceae bacterium]|nr:glutamate--tRNA ligase [Flavobacteriaceae bacterium]
LTDIIRGEIEIDTNILDDKVLFKSDGMPTYHLANVVDDHLMEITHVIRGEEWLPSLALHYQLYTAFGWEPPKFAHLPLILKPTGKGKLSKRDGEKLGVPVFPLEWSPEDSKENYQGFREEGYFPEAVVNFLAFLGWNPGTEQEFFNIDELIDAFNLEQVNKSGSKFDIDKIQWFNHHYMQQQPSEGIAKAFKKRTKELDEVDVNYITLVVDLIKERANLVSDLWSLSHYFFQPPTSFDENAFKKAVKEGTTETLEGVKQIILTTQEFTAANLQFKIKEWITENQIGFGKVMMPLRLALVGELQGPDVFEIMFLIGKAETVNRINRLLKEIG